MNDAVWRAHPKWSCHGSAFLQVSVCLTGTNCYDGCRLLRCWQVSNTKQHGHWVFIHTTRFWQHCCNKLLEGSMGLSCMSGLTQH